MCTERRFVEYRHVLKTQEGYDDLFDDWSDLVINEEKWDLPKTTYSTPLEDLMYTDPQYVPLPFIEVHDWKRPSELFPDNIECVIYKDIDGYTDLLSGSRHLLDNVLVRRFISTIAHLEYISVQQPFDVEHVSSSYRPTTFNDPWRPWHHVYSITKVGKDHRHDPRFNNLGKYVLRLYWFGGWKRVLVDDLLPIDKDGHLLLPGTTDIQQMLLGTHEERQVELWPYLLFKGFCKVAILTCEKGTETINASFMSMFTGWLTQRLVVDDLSAEERWTVFNKYSPGWQHLPEENVKKKKEGRVESNPSKVYLVIVSGNDMTHLQRDANPGVTPTFGLYSYVCENRQKFADSSEMPRWKKFRWLPWAVNAGLIHTSDMNNVRCLHIVEPFRSTSETVVYNEESVLSSTVPPIANNAKTSPPRSVKQKKIKKDTTKDPYKSKLKPNNLPDISQWINFESVSDYLDHCLIFNVPSKFTHWNCITNVKKRIDSLPDKKNEDGPKQNFYHYNCRLKPKRNEAVYLLVDSVEEETLFVCAQIFGDGYLLKKSLNEQETIINEIMDDKMCNVRLCPEYTQKFAETVMCVKHKPHEERPIAQYSINRYDWNKKFVGEVVFSGATLGHEGHSIAIGPGRKVYEIYINSLTHYYLDILSDVPIKLGTQHEIIAELSHESERFLKKLYEISNDFGKLIKAFGSDDYVKEMRNFVASIKPKDVTLNKNESILIRDIFLNNLLLVVRSNFTDQLKEVLFALKILFIDFRFHIRDNLIGAVNVTELGHCECSISHSSEILNAKRQEQAATKVQALFKAVYVRRLLKYRDKKHKDFAKTYQTLCTIYEKLFSVRTVENVLLPLFRRVLFAEDTKDVLLKYEFVEDLRNTIELQQFSGNCFAKTNDWNPISKFVIFCKCKSTNALKITMTCNLVHYTIKIFDNDTKKEICMTHTNVLVDNLQENLSGYTVMAYGWTELEERIDWKMSFLTTKGCESKFDVRTVPIVEDVIIDNYVRNLLQLICRFTIRIKEDVSVTMRFSATSDKVRLRLLYKRENGEILDEIEGNSQLLLPLVFLRTKKSASNSISDELQASTSSLSDDTVYVIEVYDEGGWRLTPEETELCSRSTMANRQYRRQDSKDKETSSYIRLEGSKDSSHNFLRYKEKLRSYSNPYYKLCVVHDGNVETGLYPKKVEALNEIKRGWYANDPARYEASVKLRENFLAKHPVTSEKELLLNESLNVPYNTNDSMPNVSSCDVKNELEEHPLNDSATFNETQDGFLKERNRLINDQAKRNRVLNEWYQRIRAGVKAKVDSVLKRRQTIMQDVKDKSTKQSKKKGAKKIE